MKHTEIMQADYLDILFDGRNKNYGGYELRKHYDRRMGTAAGIMLAAALLVWGSSLWHKEPALLIRPNITAVAPTVIDVTPPAKELKKETLPTAAAKKIKTELRTPPVIVRTDKVPDDKLLIKPNSNAVAGPANSEGDTADIVSSPAVKTGTGNKPAVVINNTPRVYVEHMPQFDGDMAGFINAHLQYPDAARETNIAGRVLVRFVINEDGAVSNATVVQGIGGGCDEEAIKMVKSMPKWKPGMQGGIPVKVMFTLPVKFVLN